MFGRTPGQRPPKLLALRHDAPRMQRALLYAIASLRFARMVRGTDRPRFFTVVAAMIWAELIGRERRVRRIAVKYRGERLTVYVDRLNDVDVLSEVFIDRAYDCLNLPGEPATILDLGAHIGAAALALHVQFPQARIAAVEADLTSFARLALNLAPIDHVSLLNAAVSDHDGTVDFFRSKEAWGSSLTPSRDGVAPITVPARSFSTLLGALQLDIVDLLKVDIEGAEWSLMSSIDSARVKTIVMEWHADMHGHQVDELNDLLPGHRVCATALGNPGRYLVVAKPV